MNYELDRCRRYYFEYFRISESIAYDKTRHEYTFIVYYLKSPSCLINRNRILKPLTSEQWAFYRTVLDSGILLNPTHIIIVHLNRRSHLEITRSRRKVTDSYIESIPAPSMRTSPYTLDNVLFYLFFQKKFRPCPHFCEI